MNASTTYDAGQSSHRPDGRRGCRGNWGPMNIAAMVGGFIIFPPLGLAVLAYNIMAKPGTAARWADEMRTRYHAYRDEGGFSRQCQGRSGWGGNRGMASTGNTAFDDYRAETMRRLDEERRRLEAEVTAFHAFQDDLKRARDREEFDRYMAQRNQDTGTAT